MIYAKICLFSLYLYIYDGEFITLGMFILFLLVGQLLM